MLKLDISKIFKGTSKGCNSKALIHVAFAVSITIAPLSMVSRCGAFIDTLPYGFSLLGESLAFMGSAEDQYDMAPQSALVCHPKDPLPPWRDSTHFSRDVRKLLYLVSTTPVIADKPLALAHSILWHPLDKGITLVKLFGGISTRLAVVLDAGLTVQQYVYMDNSQMSTHVARHHNFNDVVPTAITSNYHS